MLGRHLIDTLKEALLCPMALVWDTRPPQPRRLWDIGHKQWAGVVVDSLAMEQEIQTTQERAVWDAEEDEWRARAHDGALTPSKCKGPTTGSTAKYA